MQDFTPEEGKYDLIWCQWVLGHLTDGEMCTPSGHQCPLFKENPVYSADHLVAFFQRCLKGLSPGGGLIVVKENVADTGAVFDEQDSSVTR